MKRILILSLSLLTFALISSPLWGQASRFAGIYCGTVMGGPDGDKSFIFTLSEESGVWTAQFIEASVDGSIQNPHVVTDVAVNLADGHLTLQLDSQPWTGQWVESEDGKQSLLLTGGGKQLALLRVNVE